MPKKWCVVGVNRVSEGEIVVMVAWGSGWGVAGCRVGAPSIPGSLEQSMLA